MVKRKMHRRPKRKKLSNKRHKASPRKAYQKKGLGTEIVELFRGIGLRPGEEIPELRITIEPPDFGE